MSFIKSFEKVALIPVSEKYNEMYENGAVNYYKIVHSPWLSGAKSAIKYGLPTAVISAVVSPKSLKLRNALALGSLVGGITGLSSFGEQQYSNSLEAAHLKYHLGDT